jgi:hypothetical protein
VPQPSPDGTPPRPTRYWIGVASRDHVRRGVESGFCQLAHGKASAVRRLAEGDWIVYYSPRSEMQGGDPVQAFTALGQVRPGAPYPFDMGNGFVPVRRDVDYLPCREAPIRPLVEQLGFIRNKQSWGAAFRFGQVEISQADFDLIRAAMAI